MPVNYRKPKSAQELRFWLENMIWYHHFGDEEISAATGLTLVEVMQARSDLDITVNNRPPRPPDAPLLALPYPGGRHPRIQFLEGAVRPQRETKVSIFTPWDLSSYAVADLPEAVFSNLGLTYLAHTHLATIWTEKGIDLEPLEWDRREDGTLEIERALPDKIRFGARVTPTREAARMELWIANGTDGPLTGLKTRVCVLLKGLSGFENLTNENKVLEKPFAACRASQQDRWVLTTWEQTDRVWGNPPCPCMHADPVFKDLAPGESQRLRGWLSFYEGKDVRREFERVRKAGWLRGFM